MALIDKKILTPIRYHQDNANTVIGQASTMKALFDQGAEDLRVKLNGVIDELLATTGAQQIGIDPARGLGNTLADALTNIKNYMNLGASSISAATIGTGSGNTVQAQLEWLLLQIQNVLLNQIPDGTITMQKLATALANTINGNTSNIGDLATLTTTEKTNLVGAVNELVSQLAQHLNDDENPHLFAKRPITSLSNKTYYIDAVNGNDSNDGLTSGTAFKTWSKMTEVFPFFLNNYYTIRIIGNLDEQIRMSTIIIGRNSILTITGDTNNADNHVVAGIDIHAISSDGNPSTGFNLYVQHLKSNANIMFGNVRGARINNLKSIVNSGDAITSYNSFVVLASCNVGTAAPVGIRAEHGSLIISDNNTGSATAYGLISTNASRIFKIGTQPTGTTANELTGTGGVIN